MPTCKETAQKGKKESFTGRKKNRGSPRKSWLKDLEDNLLLRIDNNENVLQGRPMPILD